jgi:hypothetical protein
MYDRKERIEMYSELIFAVHGGSYCSKPAGIVMQDHCLPIAVRESRDCGDDGFYGLWQSTGSVEEFFEIVGIDHCPQAGLYYLCTQFIDADVDSADELWGHLVRGKIGVPTLVTFDRMRLVIEQANWGKTLQSECWMWL